jgi:hypothetical protein
MPRTDHLAATDLLLDTVALGACCRQTQHAYLLKASIPLNEHLSGRVGVVQVRNMLCCVQELPFKQGSKGVPGLHNGPEHFPIAHTHCIGLWPDVL